MTLDGAPDDEASRCIGRLLVKEGGRIHFLCERRTRAGKLDSSFTLISDGKTFWWTNKFVPGPFSSPARPELIPDLLRLFTRVGAANAATFVEVSLVAEKTSEFKDFVAAWKAVDIQALSDGVRYKLESKKEGKGDTQVSVTLDPATRLPTRRAWKGDLPMLEIYTVCAVDKEIDDKLFEIPK